MAIKTLGIGIWGTGVIAEFHAQAIREIPNLKLMQVYNYKPFKLPSFMDNLS